MTDNLDTLTDAQLSEVFAVEVAGWREFGYGRTNGKPKMWETRGGIPQLSARFATSADAVLPYVAKHLEACLFSHRAAFWREMQLQSGLDTIALADSLGIYIRAGCLARRLCIALIRANRAEKGGAS